MKKGGVFFSRRFWKHALAFNIPLIPHYLSTSVLNSSDRIMIRSIIGESEAGIYSLAYSISMIMVMLNTALLQTIEPWMYKKIKDNHVEEISRVAYPAFILVAAGNIFLIAVAPEIVAIFAPEEYYSAIYVIPPIVDSVFFIFSYTFFAVFEFYFEKTHLVTLATSTGAVLNIVLNYIFIPFWGYYAAGYTTLLCYMIYAAFHYMFMRKICKQFLNDIRPYDIKIYLEIVIVFLLISFCLLFTYRSVWLRYSIIIALALLLIFKRNLIVGQLKKLMSVRKFK